MVVASEPTKEAMMKRSYERPVLSKQKPLADVTAQPYYYISPIYGAPPGGGTEPPGEPAEPPGE